MISQIQQNFKEHGINFEDSNDLPQIYNLKSYVEKEILNNDKIINSGNYESNFLIEYIAYIKDNKKCKICNSSLKSDYINHLCEEKKSEIENINNNLEENKKN